LNGTGKNREDLYQRELETILRFGALVNSSLHIETVLDHAMEWAEEFMGATASSVYELDEDTGELFVRLARGEKKEPIRNIRLRVGEGIAGRVVERGEPIVVQDVDREAGFSDKFDKKTGFHTRSMICVPLILRNRPVGALQVINKKSGEPFSPDDLTLLTGMAQQIAVALENAKLYQRLQDKFTLTEKELKKTQEKLIRTERLSAMGHLVQGVAHEIRNPIMTIGGFARRIQGKAEQEEGVMRYAGIILEETARLENLVRQVHEFADVQTAKLQMNRIEAVIEELYSKIEAPAREQKVDVHLHMDEDLPMVLLDCSQLARALMNIAQNGLEAMAGGGTLEIHVHREDGHLVVAVSDTGRGIDPDQLDSLYDPFVTSKTRGAGLGLTMAHQIILNHNGEIHIQSVEGQGATVTIRIPIPPARPAGDIPIEPDGASSSSGISS
jgi:hypothetical protein